MRLCRVLVLLLMLLLGHLPAKAAATPAALGGITELSGDRTAAVLVRAPRPFVLRDPAFVPEARGDFKVRGGPMSGFALRSADKKIVFVGSNLPGPQSGGTYIQALAGADPAKSTWTLPAGNYTLYLLSTAPGTRVTLTMRGLTGRSFLHPREARALTFDRPTQAVGTPAPYAKYGAGVTRDIKSPSLHMAIMTVTQPLLTEISHDTCFYIGRPSGPSPYEPACPGTSEFSNRGSVLVSDENTESQVILFSSGFADATPGTYGTGMAFISGSTASAVGHHQFWLTW